MFQVYEFAEMDEFLNFGLQHDVSWMSIFIGRVNAVRGLLIEREESIELGKLWNSVLQCEAVRTSIYIGCVNISDGG